MYSCQIMSHFRKNRHNSQSGMSFKTEIKNMKSGFIMVVVTPGMCTEKLFVYLF